MRLLLVIRLYNNRSPYTNVLLINLQRNQFKERMSANEDLGPEGSVIYKERMRYPKISVKVMITV